MRYVVLQANQDLGPGKGLGLAPGFDSLSPSAWNSSTRANLSLEVKTIDGHETDGGELRADPKNVVVMDAGIHLSLIEAQTSAVDVAASLTTAGTLKMPGGLIGVNAHTSSFSGQGVTVAVLDTGCDVKHPAFKNTTIVSKNFLDDTNDVTDTNGHGTHCAGTICGGEVDGVRVGVAPGVTKLCVGKIIGPNGGSLEQLLKALFWAVIEQKASVVSMSLGYDLPGNQLRLQGFGYDPQQATQAVLRQQQDLIRGIATLRAFLQSQAPSVALVAASGNESHRRSNPPFILDTSMPAAELVSIGAVGPCAGTPGKWEVADFSNARPAIVAPGVDVISAKAGGGWVAMSGTSMATPHVAGVAALWVQKLRKDGQDTLPDIVVSQLKATARRDVLCGNDFNAYGAGMVQAPQ